MPWWGRGLLVLAFVLASARAHAGDPFKLPPELRKWAAERAKLPRKPHPVRAWAKPWLRDTGEPDGPKGRLDTVARGLFSGQGDALLDRLRADIQTESKSTRFFGDPYFHLGPLPKDPFLRKVALLVTERAEMDVHAGIMGGAVADVLAELADERGFIDHRKLLLTYGPRAATFLAAASRISASGDPGSVDLRLDRYASDQLKQRMRVLRPLSRPSMPSFQRLLGRHARERPLAGFRVAGIQHLLGTTAGLLRGLSASGVDPNDIVMLGKQYSQHMQVVAELRDEGYRIVPAGASASGWEMDRMLNDATRGLAPGEKLLLLDDGGQLLAYVNERRPDLHGRVVGVEQTRKGIRLLEKLTMRFPVIDVAQSWAKLRYEAPMIGRSVGMAVVDKLAKLAGSGVDTGQVVVLLGYGVVGQATARYLKGLGYRVEAWDPRADALATALKDGVKPLASRTEALSRGRILVAATGETSLTAADARHLPNEAVLFNAGSPGEISATLHGLAEFEGLHMDFDHRIRTRFAGVDIDLGDVLDGSRRDRVLTGPGGKQFLLANEGLVVNFTGEADPIPARYIQLTRGLLYLGALQAARTTQAGIHALDPGGQHKLVRSIKRELAKTGESLSRPTF